MAESKIQWTDHTWNPWHGCIKVSAGCKNCYMYRDKERYGQDPKTVLRSKTGFNAPLKITEGKKIFTCSWSDFFIEQADPWREEAWDIIRRTPQHQYQILTKRPERIAQHLPPDWRQGGFDHVWVGVSVESHNELHRIKDLLHARTDNNVLFISYEPALGPLNLEKDPVLYEIFREHIGWVILGGESGNQNGKYKYRTPWITWLYNAIEICEQNNIPVFVKQLGTGLARSYKLRDRHGGDISEFAHYPRLQKRFFPHKNS